MTHFAPEGLPLVNKMCPSRFAPPDPSTGFVMADVHGSYMAYHRDFTVETLNPRGQVIAITPFSPNYPYLIFGRDPGSAHVFVGHDSVSAQHAALFWARLNGAADFCYIMNLESTHGIKIEGQLMEASGITAVGLGEGITFGNAPVSFRFVAVPADPAATAPPVDPRAPGHRR
jgi:hypothetical protein